jgi:cation-transporting ATPase 13A3/4/5
MKLLTDEILNPFYVFQIGSILLWCMDDYYYYAFCIFIISAFSITSSLIETKQVIFFFFSLKDEKETELIVI